MRAVLRVARPERTLAAEPETQLATQQPESQQLESRELEPPEPELPWSPVSPPVRCLYPERAASAARQPSRVDSAAREPFALEPDAAPPSRPVVPAALAPAAAQPTTLSPGPLQLDLSRIVLPHRVADVPPPPPFIFRPLPSSRRAAQALAIARATPPLQPLGYRVVEQRAASCQVQRRWRVDVAPCLAVLAALPEASPAPAPVHALPPLAPLAPEPVLPELEQSPESGQRRKPGEGAQPPSSKKQRRRAARVSSASLMTAALPGNAELSRTLSELEADFAERRIEQPAASRKRRARRGSAQHGARARRAANAV